MDYKSVIRVVAIFLVSGCVNTQSYLVLEYKEFGPQVLAWQQIGKGWWQWDSHGDSDPGTDYDIKVVVYRNVPLSVVQTEYPVVPELTQDYRYIEFDTALEYLDSIIEENFEPELTKRLTRTREKILTTLGR